MFGILKYIDLNFFLLALAVGIFFTFISTPVPEVIIKYPTPNNAGKITYVDDANVCYKYRPEEVKCPEDSNKITDMKIQQHDPEKVNGEGLFTRLFN